MWLTLLCSASMASIRAGSSSGDLLTIVAINGTVLTLLFTAVSVYAVVVIQAVDSMVTEVVETASRISYLTYPAVTGDRDWYHPERGDEASELVTTLNYLVSPAPSEAAGPDDPVFRGDAKERADAALQIVTEVCGHKPFPQRMIWSANDKRWVVGPRTQPLAFENVATVRKWVDEIHVALHNISLGFVDDATAKALFEEASQQHHESISGKRTFFYDPVTEASIAQTLRRLDPLTIYRGQEDFLRQARQVVTDTARALEKLKRYQGRVANSRGWLTGLFLVLAVAFVAGVIMPLVHRSVSVVLSTWVPAGAYTLLLAGGLVLLVRALWRKG